MKVKALEKEEDIKEGVIISNILSKIVKTFYYKDIKYGIAIPLPVQSYYCVASREDVGSKDREETDVVMNEQDKLEVIKLAHNIYERDIKDK